MRTATHHFDHLTVAGVEIMLPAVVCIEHEDATVLAAFASGEVEGVLAPLLGRWLAPAFGTAFRPEGQNECTLAGDAFRDKLRADFGWGSGFVAALVTDARVARSGRSEHLFEPVTRFLQGSRLVRWSCTGMARAYVNLAHRSAVVVFDGMPGALALNCAQARGGGKHARNCIAEAWYGFGRPQVSPEAILGALGEPTHLARRAKREHDLHV